MTREDQIKKATEIIAYGCSDELKAALIQDFPELRESEDKRIMEEIIKTISWIVPDCQYAIVLPREQKDKWLAYLEKQKELPTNEEMLRTLRVEYEKGIADTIAKYEQKEQRPAKWNPNNEDVILFNKAVTTNPNLTPSERAKLDIIRTKFKHCNEIPQEQKPVDDIIGRAMSYFGAESLLDNANGLSNFEKFTAWLYCEFLRGLPKKLNQEYIKEQTSVILDAAQKELCKMPDSTKLIEMWDKEKANLEEKDFRGDTWRIAYNAFMDGFAKGTCVKFDRQKEQKLKVKDPFDDKQFKRECLKATNKPLEQSIIDTCKPIKNVAEYLDEQLQQFKKEQKPTAIENLAEHIKAEFEGFRNLLKKKGIDYQPGQIYWDDFAKLFVSSARKYGLQKPAEWSWQPIIDALTKWLTEKIAPLHKKSLDGTITEREEMFRAALLEIRSLINSPDFQIGKDTSAEWSEEDERMLKSIIWHISYSVTNGKNTDCKCDLTEWLKEKLKSLRPQKLDASKLENFDPVDVLNRIKTEWPMAWEKVIGKEEWSEEDENKIESIKGLITMGRFADANTIWTVWNLLDSLRPSWKPSEEQMEALSEAVSTFDGYEESDAIKSLYNDLKKLKGGVAPMRDIDE